MEEFGHPLRDGLSSQATEPKVSALRASIPDAGWEDSTSGDYEVVTALRLAANWAIGFNQAFADDDAKLLGILAARAIDAGLAPELGEKCSITRAMIAKAMEARRAETQSGSVHDSAAPTGFAQGKQP